MTPDQKPTKAELQYEIIEDTTSTVKMSSLSVEKTLQHLADKVNELQSILSNKNTNTTQSTSNTTNTPQEGKEEGVRRCERRNDWGSFKFCKHCDNEWRAGDDTPICRGVK